MRFLIPLIALTATAFAADAAVLADGKTVATLTVPDGWQAIAKADTTLVPPSKTPHIQVRAVAGTVEESVAKAAALIVDQVKDFKIVTTTDVTLGKIPAKRLIGTGTEADDGDPAKAEVTVFAVAGRTILVISHGEGNGAAERRADLDVILATAR
ncbi:hypothetical protein LBMAG53_13150 [Planctomycetota bacterium]|nr:hypothetical protein LBMAG53_13150 [Planctomycetota bacterium]